jgi:protoheme IX farnesyltransferase
LKQYINILSELTKIRITIFVTITTCFGYISSAGEMNSGIILPSIGILLLACGSAAINHYQERHTDALMERTKNRPIPSGRISPENALMIAIILLLVGAGILFISAGLTALCLGLLNLLWYNGIYTPLKKKSALAIIPGSMVGAIPPAVGWVAAGGSVSDPRIIILAFFFFIWQIPHFWLLLLILAKDYEKAGFPTLTKIFTNEQLSRITFMWIIATIVTGFLIPLFGIVKYPLIEAGLFISGIWLAFNSIKLLKVTGETRKYNGFVFRRINLFAVMVVILLSIEKLIV